MKRLKLTWQGYTEQFGRDAFRSPQPWIELSVGSAEYTIYNAHDEWRARWWHGNRGHIVPCDGTLDSAKMKCEEHLNAMLTGIISNNGGINDQAT